MDARALEVKPHRRTLALLSAMVLLSASGRIAAQSEDHQYTTERILAGAATYAANCQLCHGRAGDGMGNVNLARQRFKRAITDEDIRTAIRTGSVTAGMPPFPTLRQDELDGLVAFIRSGFDREGAPLRLGSAERGKALFEGRGGCAECHRPRGDGPNASPSVIDIASKRLPSEIRKTLLDPSTTLWPINRPVRIVTQDGKTYRGRRLNEDTFTVLLIDQDSRLVAVPKARIREFEKSTKSAMPSYAGKLSDEEIADLMGYLVTLKGH